MWQVHLETTNYSGSEILHRKSAKIVSIFSFVTRKLLVGSRWNMATLCTEVCFCCWRWNRRKSPSFGKVMGESSLTIEYDARKWVSEYLSTAALPTSEALAGHVSCITASLAQARLLYTLILMYLQRRLHSSRAKKWALLEEDYLIPIQVMAVDCDRWGAEWRKRQEHWQVSFVTDCWLL